MIPKKILIIILNTLLVSGLFPTEVKHEPLKTEATMKDKQVLISGAGIAGFTLAYWLKQRGYSPTIIERHPYLREGGYKVDVRGTALEVAKRMGVYQNLIDANVNLKKSKLVTSQLKTFEFDGDMLGYCSEGDIEVNRWDLVQILAKAAGEIEIIYDDSITKIDELVHFEKGEPRAFDLVIGADGVYSNVRKIAFGEDSKFLRTYGIHFCIFPISNIFALDRSEIVYFNKGKLIAAYAVNGSSYAALAFKSKEETSSFQDSKLVFEEEFKDLGWEVPTLLSAMNRSDACYFNTIAQVRMPYWSKGRVALIGDAAHATSGMGTSLAMTGAYVLARELEASKGDYATAFSKYEQSMRGFVERAQDLSESNQQLLAEGDSSIKMTIKLFLMKILPKKSIQLMTQKGRKEMREVANGLTLEPITKSQKLESFP